MMYVGMQVTSFGGGVGAGRVGVGGGAGRTVLFFLTLVVSVSVDHVCRYASDLLWGGGGGGGGGILFSFFLWWSVFLLMMYVSMQSDLFLGGGGCEGGVAYYYLSLVVCVSSENVFRYVNDLFPQGEVLLLLLLCFGDFLGEGGAVGGLREEGGRGLRG